MKTKNLLLISFLALTASSVVAQFKQVIIPYYDQATELYGYKDSALNMAAIPAKYQYADRHYEGLARIQQNDKWGFIAFSGKEIVPAIYDDALNFKDSVAAVKQNDKWGYIDKTGKVIIPFQYAIATDFHEDRAAVFNGEFWGFINKKGFLGIDYMFGYDENVYPVFKEGLANVKFRDNYGFIGVLGQIVIPFNYDYALPFDNGLAAVQKDYKWGFINKNGKEIIPIKYEIGGNTFPVFNEGLTPVSVDNKYGFVNRQGKEVIPLIYDYASNFEKGKAPVRLGSQSFYINTEGERIDD
jgi:hypothetical protein